MQRILIGSVFQETNTFSPFLTGIDEFKRRNYFTGEEVIRKFENTRTALGAFIETLDQWGNCKIIPSIAAVAEPSGPVKSDAISEIKNILIETLNREGKVDGVLLSLHGAMVTEDEDDGDGDILKCIRDIVGDEVPIIATLDLHTNLTEKMISNANALIPYEEYPHVDMYDRGLEAAQLMIQTLKGIISPVMGWCSLPLLVPLVDSKSYPNLRKFIQDIRRDKDVLLANIVHGFYLSDTRDTRAATLAITDGNAEKAQQIADSLADAFWGDREIFQFQSIYTPEEAIADAKKYINDTVVFADISDNPGIGSTGDGTHLLKKILDAGLKNVAFAIIVDPETVDMCHKAGTGSKLKLQLGGKKYPEFLGEPINCYAYVKALHDGRYNNRGPMHGSLEVDLQKSAVIVIEGITVIVTSVATQTYDIEIFQSHGLMLKDFRILVVKSSVHYRAAFKPYSKMMYSIECPGIMKVNPESIEYLKLPRTIYPFNKDLLYKR